MIDFELRILDSHRIQPEREREGGGGRGGGWIVACLAILLAPPKTLHLKPQIPKRRSGWGGEAALSNPAGRDPAGLFSPYFEALRTGVPRS